jgi:hypothetical protein
MHFLRVPRIQHLSMFDALSTNNSWNVAMKKYKNLGDEYEKYLRIWTNSDMHCTFDDLDYINPDPEKCPSPCTIYMHLHRQERPSLLNACVSFLPKGVVSQSKVRGDHTWRTAELGMAPVGRHGPSSRANKAEFKSTSAHLALESIASKNNAKTQLIVAEEQQLAMKSDKNLFNDIYNIKQKRRKTLHDFVAHCGDKEMAKMQIDNVKAQELHKIFPMMIYPSTTFLILRSLVLLRY